MVELIPSEAELLAYPDQLSNWGRWGDDDELGTLRLMTDATRLAALALPRLGRSVSLARPVTTADINGAVMHHMVRSGDSADPHGRGSMSDWIGIRFHGRTITHLDALSHYFWKRRSFNGRTAEQVTAEHGASFSTAEHVRDGIIGRGVLLDVPRVLGIDLVAPENAITPDILEECERQAGLTVGTGDVLIVRTGRDLRDMPERVTGALAGLRPDCLPWLRARDVAVLVGDGVHDQVPPRYPAMPNPVHVVGLTAIGLWLIDNAYLEDLADACHEAGRYEFLFIAAPLALRAATGSPLSPLAIL